MQPLTGYEFAPGRLPSINAALSTAAAALPEPGLDPAENTEAYKKTLNAALTAALPKPAPEPEPDPELLEVTVVVLFAFVRYPPD